jgi:TetR/AcrR family transcriptional regulator
MLPLKDRYAGFFGISWRQRGILPSLGDGRNQRFVRKNAGIMNKPARADTETFRQRAREAAVRLFSRNGFEGTSVQQVADELGVSKQALLYHFSSKEGLREAVFVEVVDRWQNVLPRLLASLTQQDVGLEQTVAEIIEVSRAEPAYARFLMHELLRDARDPVVQDIDSWLTVAADIIRTAQNEGKVDPRVDAEAWLVNIGTIILATLCLLDARPGEPSPARVVRELARSIGASLRPPAPATPG